MNILSLSQLQKIDDRSLYEYCQFVGKEARIWKNQFVALLPEVAKRGLHKQHGFATIVEFAAKVGGVGRKTVEAIFQVERMVNDKPALQGLVSVVGVNKMRIVATIATKENQNFLAEKVKEMSKGALEVWTRDIRKQREKGLLDKTQQGDQNRLFVGANQNNNNDSSDNNFGGCTNQQNLFNIPQSCPFPPGRSKREKYSFGLDEAVSFKLRLFKQKLEKEKKIALEWNDVIGELLKRAEK